MAALHEWLQLSPAELSHQSAAVIGWFEKHTTSDEGWRDALTLLERIEPATTWDVQLIASVLASDDRCYHHDVQCAALIALGSAGAILKPWLLSDLVPALLGFVRFVLKFHCHDHVLARQRRAQEIATKLLRAVAAFDPDTLEEHADTLVLTLDPRRNPMRNCTLAARVLGALEPSELAPHARSLAACLMPCPNWCRDGALPSDSRERLDALRLAVLDALATLAPAALIEVLPPMLTYLESAPPPSCSSERERSVSVLSTIFEKLESVGDHRVSSRLLAGLASDGHQMQPAPWVSIGTLVVLASLRRDQSSSLLERHVIDIIPLLQHGVADLRHAALHALKAVDPATLGRHAPQLLAQLQGAPDDNLTGLCALLHTMPDDAIETNSAVLLPCRALLRTRRRRVQEEAMRVLLRLARRGPKLDGMLRDAAAAEGDRDDHDSDEARSRRLDGLLDDVGDAIRGLGEEEPLCRLARAFIDLVEAPGGAAATRRAAEVAANFSGPATSVPAASAPDASVSATSVAPSYKDPLSRSPTPLAKGDAHEVRHPGRRQSLMAQSRALGQRLRDLDARVLGLGLFAH